VAGYEAGSWFGIGAPKGTPANVIEKLNGAINAAFENASIRSQLAELGATTLPGSSAQFGAFIAEETEQYAGAIRRMKMAAK
jgi:tripartite-type tricarboxylate transporter receptor subunit TctC